VHWWWAAPRPSSPATWRESAEYGRLIKSIKLNPGLSAAQWTGEAQARALIAQLERRCETLETRFEDSTIRWRRIGSGPPLVLLHGGNGSWLHWVRNIETLAQRMPALAAGPAGLRRFR